MKTRKFDFIFHFAAVVGVKRTLTHPLLVLEDIVGIKNILKLSQQTGVKRLFFSSSSEVYGEPVEIPQREDSTPLNARLPYAVVKNVNEVFIKAYQQQYNLPYTIFRFFNTYGPKQSEDFVVAKFIKQAKNNEDITLYGNGDQTRTFCFIDDSIETILRIFADELAVNQTLNLGSDRQMAIRDVAKLIIRLTNSKSKITHTPPLPQGDMTRRQPDNTRMKKILGRELISLESGIIKILHAT